jgi:hypothetical protein
LNTLKETDLEASTLNGHFPSLSGAKNDASSNISLTGIFNLIGLRPKDAFFVGLTFLLCLACFHRQVVSAAGGPITIFLSVFAMLNPYSAVLFLAASQTLPDPPGFTFFTPARLSAIGFAATLVFNPRRITALAEGLRGLLIWLGPYLCFTVFKRVFIWGSAPFDTNMLLAYATCLMATCYADEIKGRHLTWLFTFCLGCVVPVAGWVFHNVGVDSVLVTIVNERYRLFFGRAANATNIGLVTGIVGLMAWWVVTGARKASGTGFLGRIFPFFVYALIGTGAITVLASQSRGGAIALGIASIATIVSGSRIHKLTWAGSRDMLKQFAATMCVVFGIAGAIYLIPETGMQQSVESMRAFSEMQMAQHQTNFIFSSRPDIYYNLLDFLESPILGIMPGQWQHATNMAHNVFVMIAKAFGIIGLLLYLRYFFGPTLRARKLYSKEEIWAFLICLFALFLGFSNLPFPNHKIFHVFNGMLIAMLAVSPSQGKAK